MNKSQLIEAVAKKTGLTKADSQRAIDSLHDIIKGALKKGDQVQLIGFGRYHVSKRKATNGRNPQTGEAIKIAARKLPRFSAGKELKDAINGRK